MCALPCEANGACRAPRRPCGAWCGACTRRKRLAMRWACSCWSVRCIGRCFRRRRRRSHRWIRVRWTCVKTTCISTACMPRRRRSSLRRRLRYRRCSARIWASISGRWDDGSCIPGWSMRRRSRARRCRGRRGLKLTSMRMPTRTGTRTAGSRWTSRCSRVCRCAPRRSRWSRGGASMRFCGRARGPSRASRRPSRWRILMSRPSASARPACLEGVEALSDVVCATAAARQGSGRAFLDDGTTARASLDGVCGDARAHADAAAAAA